MRLDGGMFRILPYGTGICHYTNQIEERKKKKKKKKRKKEKKSCLFLSIPFI